MLTLLRQELLLATRSGFGAVLPAAFFLIVTAFVPFGIGPELGKLQMIAPGILWLGMVLSALLTLDKMFQPDFEDGTLERLLTSPVPAEGIVAAKILAHWLTTCLPLCAIAPIYGLLLGLPIDAGLAGAGSLLIGSPAISAAGSIGAATTLHANRGSLLLALLVLPICVPAVILGAEAAGLAGNGESAIQPLLLLAALSLASLALFPFASAHALRINLR